MPICDHCGKDYPAGEGVWGNGDYMCGECVQAHLVETGQIPLEPLDDEGEVAK